MNASARAAVLVVRVAGIDARQRGSPSSLSAELTQQLGRSPIAASVTRSPSRHSVSATRVTRGSSAASRKNGRRNGQRQPIAEPQPPLAHALGQPRAHRAGGLALEQACQ